MHVNLLLQTVQRSGDTVKLSDLLDEAARVQVLLLRALVELFDLHAVPGCVASEPGKLCVAEKLES